MSDPDHCKCECPEQSQMMYLEHCDKYACGNCILDICYNCGEKGGSFRECVDFYINKIKVMICENCNDIGLHCNSCERDHEPYADIHFCNGCDWTYCNDCYDKWFSESEKVCYQCIVKEYMTFKNYLTKLQCPVHKDAKK